MMGFVIVVVFLDVIYVSDLNGFQLKNVGGVYIVDIWGDLVVIMQFCQMRCCFVVVSNKDGEIGGFFFFIVIVREVVQFMIFGWDGYDCQVIGVVDGLKVIVDDEDIDVILVVFFI